MIEGAVSGNSEAIIRLALHAATGATQEIDAIIDTGFAGDLTLPPALIRRLKLSWKGRGQALLADGDMHTFDEYVGTVSWNGQSLTVEEFGRYQSPRWNGIAQGSPSQYGCDREWRRDD